MRASNLFEGIILQAMEDLWSDGLRQEGIEFFRGEGFTTCADIAGMDLYEQVKTLNIVNSILKHQAVKIRHGGNSRQKMKMASNFR